MKINILAAAVAATFLAGCSSLSKTTDKKEEKPAQPVASTPASQASGHAITMGPRSETSEQRVASEFRRDGVRVIYNLMGELEAIEVTAYAPVWGNTQNAAREAFRVAELEAKKAMNDFINKETITSSVSVAMISRNLERVKDSKNNTSSNTFGRDSVASEISDEELLSENESQGRQNNSGNRQDAVNIASRVNTNISVRNTGILSGLYPVESELIDNGRNVRTVYRWDRRSAQARGTIRNLMMQ